MRRQRIVRAARIGVVLAVCAVGIPAAAAIAAPTAPAGQAAPALPVAPARPAVAGKSVTPAQAVKRIGLRATDLRLKGIPAHATVEPFDGGDLVSKDPENSTLTYCGYTFRSEGYRVARHQTLLNVDGHYFGVSSEVVAYDTPAHAKQALAEWRLAVTRCHSKEFFPPIVPGADSLRYDKQALVRHAGLPARNYAWTTSQVTDKDTGLRYSWNHVLQQHGRYLDIVWGTWRLDAPRPGQKAAIAAVAVATGKRMVALPQR